MDEIKDIERKDTISHFLTGKQVRTQPFGDNISGDRAYRRAERVVAALHLVTNHVPSHEPARSATRQAGLDLLSSVLSLRDEMRISESPLLAHTQACIRRLISLVRMLSAGKYLSLPNADTLVDALDELGVFLVASQRTSLSESTVLTREELLDTGNAPMPQARAAGRVSKRQRRSSLTDTAGKKVGMSDRGTRRVDRAQARSEGIVSILGSQGTLGIKDISAHLPEYSEKMIQRELKNLVAVGKIKKTGAKRWSMYALAQ